MEKVMQVVIITVALFTQKNGTGHCVDLFTSVHLVSRHCTSVSAGSLEAAAAGWMLHGIQVADVLAVQRLCAACPVSASGSPVHVHSCAGVLLWPETTLQ